MQVNFSVRALSKLGCKVDLSCNPEIDLEDYDIIHLCHLERCHDTYYFFKKAQEKHKKIFLSTIYWPSTHSPLNGFWDKQYRAAKENLINIVRLGMTSTKGQKRFVLASLRKGWLSCREQLINNVDLLLPNSQSEADILRDEKQKDVSIAIIPNVIDAKKCDAVEKLPWQQRSMILCVGHFCPRKNQIALIKALKNTDISVVFAGSYRSMHRRYYEHCRKEAAGQHTFLGGCSNDKVLELMGQTRVHVQTSTLETPGLVNLEAGLIGCNLVLPPVSPVRDYFGDLCHYFLTYQNDSIRNAVIEAINTEPDQSLEKHIRKNFTMTQLITRLSVVYQQQ